MNAPFRRLLSLISCLAAACGTEPGPSVDYSAAAEAAGFQMAYAVHVPADPDVPRLPLLLIAFHGAPGSGESLRLNTGLDSIADQYGITVAWPDAGTDGDLWSEGREDASAPAHVLLLRALIDSMGAKHGPWTAGVHLVGFSQGGLFAERAACEGDDQLASVNVVAATMLNIIADGCGAGPVTFRMVLGSADATFPDAGRDVGGGISYLSRDSVLRVWANVNDCVTVQDTVPLRLRHSGRIVQQVGFRGCERNTSVESFPLPDVRHEWPTGLVDAGYLLVQRIVDDALGLGAVDRH